MNRQEQVSRVFDDDETWDIAVVGGGATGVGIAVDAASRGYSVCLLEQSDFGKGTSSRSTKLVHGGVRYLQQGNISLVMEALKERGILRNNAPHLVHDLAFVVPNYDWWETPFYGIGMKVYDMLAGKYGFGKSRTLSKEETLKRIPTLAEKGLRGGVLYYDGQFDDARLLINLCTTAVRQGAALLNYVRVAGLHKDADGFVNGLDVEDLESGKHKHVRARSVINATGAFCDAVRRMDEPDATDMIAPSQGIHLVLDASFLGGSTSIMVPRTSDGRVMFAIPWHGYTVVGTTDTPIDSVSLEPAAMQKEVDFILETSRTYLAKPPEPSDVLSVFTGIRPLVKAGDAGSTAALSRDHTIAISQSGLMTVAGGKWTTYRNMAEDAVDHAATLGKLDERPCITKTLNIHGYHKHPEKFGRLAYYGADAANIQQLIQADPSLGEPLHKDLPYVKAQVIFAARTEMARTVDDVLSRRTRALLLNSKAAIAVAGEVAAMLGKELGHDDAWQAEQVRTFREMARLYTLEGVTA